MTVDILMDGRYKLQTYGGNSNKFKLLKYFFIVNLIWMTDNFSLFSILNI